MWFLKLCFCSQNIFVNGKRYKQGCKNYNSIPLPLLFCPLRWKGIKWPCHGRAQMWQMVDIGFESIMAKSSHVKLKTITVSDTERVINGIIECNFNLPVCKDLQRVSHLKFFSPRIQDGVTLAKWRKAKVVEEQFYNLQVLYLTRNVVGHVRQ